MSRRKLTWADIGNDLRWIVIQRLLYFAACLAPKNESGDDLLRGIYRIMQRETQHIGNAAP